MNHSLFTPNAASKTATFRLLHAANERHQLHLETYEDLWKWSTSRTDQFWDLVWTSAGIVGHKGNHVVDNNAQPADNPPWFQEARLNFAENLLLCRSREKVALIQATEPTSGQTEIDLRKYTYAQLYTAVGHVASALLKNGLEPGDRVGSYCNNCIENVVACLASIAVGGIWTAAAADFGPEGVLERFKQVKPKFIFAVDSVVYNARMHDHISKVHSLLDGLLDDHSDKEESGPKVIIIHSIMEEVPPSEWGQDWIEWDRFVEEGADCRLALTSNDEIKWKRLPFDHPCWILFSSGTTGKPKPIVHRCGGMLLQSRKELGICADLNESDVFFYYTTTGWMMWQFLIGGLASSSTLVLYDGSPLREPSLLWSLTDQCGITIFGTSAKYLDQLSRVYIPREHHDLKSLRHIYSTGSPLSPVLFDYVYRHIKKDVLLASITGGTDICSLFAGMCTALPVIRGEIQCRMLGMAVESYSEDLQVNPPNHAGELVCLRPFPCEPLGFWPLPGYGEPNDVDAAFKRFQNSYFPDGSGVWYHGDHILITHSVANNAGGIVMLGRSDGTLNPGGIRFGTSELYDILDLCFSSPNAEFQIQDYIAVGQKILGGTDERVILFVRLKDKDVLTPKMEKQIRLEVRNRRSPRHVPAQIIAVKEIPYTLNGKRVEVLLNKIINGASLQSMNLATLANPDCLAEYADLTRSLQVDVMN